MDELQISGKRFISSRRIARDNGYTSDYIGQLIRGGKVIGQKVGRAWYVDAISFESYLGSDGAEVPIKRHQPEIPDQRSSDLLVRQSTQDAGEARPFAQEFPAPAIKVEEIQKEEPVKIKEAPEPVVVVEKKEESHYVPLHIVKAEAPAGLRYYSDDRPSLPQIREVRAEKSEPWIAYPTEETTSMSEDIIFTPHAAHRTRPFNVAGLAALGLVVFIFSAVISSLMSLDLSIEAGNTASAAYSLHW